MFDGFFGSLIFIVYAAALFYYIGRLEGRLKHIQDAIARLEGKKEKK